MIFQHFNLLWSRTVSENIELALEIAGNKDKRIRQQKVQELVELVGLTGRENAYPSELSGGQKQRVALARALVRNQMSCSWTNQHQLLIQNWSEKWKRSIADAG